MAINRCLGGLALGALVLAVTRCGTAASSTSTGPATAVTVSSTLPVTGKWTGLLELKGGGRATGTLYESAPASGRQLVVVGAAPNGRRFMVRLRPAP